MADTVEKFAEKFGVPACALPYLSTFVTKEEMELVVLFDGAVLTSEAAAARLGISKEKAESLLEDAYRKSVFDRKITDGETNYIAASFYEVLDYCCKFNDAYFAIPQEVREEIDSWCFEEYKKKMISRLEEIRDNTSDAEDSETFLLLDELDEFLSSEEYRVVPCNCRKLKQGCTKETQTCLRFDRSIDDRTFGKPISKEEARQIVIKADKAGLMHTVNRDWRKNGPKYMCNCCTDCCYPFRLVEDLGLKGVWPEIRHVALYQKETCNYCGRCTKRCPFSAFHHTGSKTTYRGKTVKEVAFDPDRCFGCGLCAGTCPTKSIKMLTVKVL